MLKAPFSLGRTYDANANENANAKARNSKKPKGEKTMTEKKKLEAATPGFGPAPQFPPAKKVRPS